MNSAMLTASDPLTPSRGILASMKNWRLNAVPFLAYVLYLTLALSIVAKGGFLAQDFFIHLTFARRLFSGSFASELAGATNPPLLFLLAATAMRIFGEVLGIKLLAVAFAFLNCCALHLFWLCSARLLPQAPRLLALLFTATLPAFVTTSVVFAADALVCLPFFAFCYINLRLLEAPQQPTIKMLIGSSAVQVLGGLAKFSFLGIAPAALIFSGYLIYEKKCRPPKAFAVLLLLFLIPSAANFWILKSLQGTTAHEIQFPTLTGEMTFRSLLWPYPRDLELFSAPPYFDQIKSGGSQIQVSADGDAQIGGRPGFTILVNNRYSYPALLNLSINSDVLNITHRRMVDSNAFAAAGQLKHGNQLFQEASVILGSLYSLLVFISVPALFFSASRATFAATKYAVASSWNEGALNSSPVDFSLAVLLPALTFYGLIVGLLPFVGGEVYYGGYWLPRLVLPALPVFGLAAFWLVARASQSRLLWYFFAALTILKVCFHICLQIL